MFEIENIHVKPSKSGARTPLSKALCALDVGQSIFVPESMGKPRDYFSGVISGLQRRLVRKFAMQRVEGGYRIGRWA